MVAICCHLLQSVIKFLRIPIAIVYQVFCSLNCYTVMQLNIELPILNIELLLLNIELPLLNIELPL